MIRMKLMWRKDKNLSIGRKLLKILQKKGYLISEPYPIIKKKALITYATYA